MTAKEVYMYYFKPILLDNEKKNINGVIECKFKYDGYDSNILSGFSECEIKGNYIYIYKLEFPQDKPDFCEGLIRASLNFGANRGAYMGCCIAQNSIKVLELMGFEKQTDGSYSGDIPTLLGGSCGNCK